jgi:hypothetical protein
MGDNLNHYQIDTERKPVTTSYFYEPQLIRQNFDCLNDISINSDDPSYPKWMRTLLKLNEETSCNSLA